MGYVCEPNSTTFTSYKECQIEDSNIVTIEQFKIETINETFYETLQKVVTTLKNIRLQNTSITYIKPNIFKQFRNLYILNMAYNEIKEVKNIDAPNLTDLILDYNPIKVVKNEPLLQVTSIETLSLINCNITELYNETFSNLRELETLRLSSNNIESIPGGIFKSLNNLDSLNLSNNSITVLDNNLFCTTPLLRLVELQGNPINLNGTLYREMFNKVNLTLKKQRFEDISVDLTVNVTGNVLTCGDNCTWKYGDKNITSPFNKNVNQSKCSISICDELFYMKDCVHVEYVNSEFEFYSWLFLGAVLFIQAVITVVLFVIYLRNKDKMD